MSVRQDALKRQYAERAAGEAAPLAAPRGVDGNGRPLPHIRRHWFWRWFWFLFLLTLLFGFLHGRKDVAKWYHDHFGQDVEAVSDNAEASNGT